MGKEQRLIDAGGQPGRCRNQEGGAMDWTGGLEPDIFEYKDKIYIETRNPNIGRPLDNLAMIQKWDINRKG